MPLRPEGCPRACVEGARRSKVTFDGDPNSLQTMCGEALYASKLVSYAQGYVQLTTQRDEFGWKLNGGSIALLWRRQVHHPLDIPAKDIKNAFDEKADLERTCVLDDFFKSAIGQGPTGLATCMRPPSNRASPPRLPAALSCYDGYRRDRHL
ncbi:MAG: hypothetical protein R3C02_05650 [Planctomycetaceae bacterium]